MGRTSYLILGAVGLVLILAVVYAQRDAGEQDKPVVVAKQPETDPSSDEAPDASGGDGRVEVGGVRRPATDVSKKEQPGGNSDAAGDPAVDDERIDGDYGTTPAIPIDANPQVAAVARAKQDGTRPEFMSPVIAPKTFDLASYTRDPESYLNSPEPGRVFQPAQPGPDVPVLRRQSGYLQSVVQGESVRLQVQATPSAPVAFTSFDLGQFSNQLTTITVAADDQGIATAEFVAPPGTINRVNILSASPVTSGQVKFVVDVSLP